MPLDSRSRVTAATSSAVRLTADGATLTREASATLIMAPFVGRAAASHAGEHDAGRAAGFDHRMALQIGGVKHAAARVEAEEAWRAAARRLPADGCKPPGGRIDAEDHDAVVPAVGGVDEIPRRGDLDLGRRIV